MSRDLPRHSCWRLPVVSGRQVAFGLVHLYGRRSQRALTTGKFGRECADDTVILSPSERCPGSFSTQQSPAVVSRHHESIWARTHGIHPERFPSVYATTLGGQDIFVDLLHSYSRWNRTQNWGP